jgi:hypothetical protein
MTIQFKLSGTLYGEIKRDLERPHPFAAERVGFVSGRLGSLAATGKLVVLTRYHSIPDDYYIDDPDVGARINSDAITGAMHTVYHGRSKREGIFHIHMHGHRGESGLSKTDWSEIPPMMPGFQAVGRQAAHGIILLSVDHGSAWVWLPARNEPTVADSISVIGAPIQVFERRVLR